MDRMSFFLTEEQLISLIKDVTRRLGQKWRKLKPGDQFIAIRKGQGLKKGQKQHVLGICTCVSNRFERLDAVTDGDVVREGFPGHGRQWFIQYFMSHMRCHRWTHVSRIEFTFESKRKE